MSDARIMRRLVKKRLAKIRGSTMRKRCIIVPVPNVLPILELDGTPAKNTVTNEPMTCSFKYFIAGRTTDPAFLSDTPRDPATVVWDRSAVVRGTALTMLFEGKEGGEVVKVDEDDWECLRRAVVKGSYNQISARSLIPFMDAVTDAKVEAKEEPPKEES